MLLSSNFATGIQCFPAGKRSAGVVLLHPVQCSTCKWYCWVERAWDIFPHRVFAHICVRAAGKGAAAGAGLDAASMRQLMGRPDGPPVRYLMTQLTGFSQPLTYPDHGGVMELRNAKHR
jgi:hypothetical protein